MTAAFPIGKMLAFQLAASSKSGSLETVAVVTNRFDTISNNSSGR